MLFISNVHGQDVIKQLTFSDMPIREAIYQIVEHQNVNLLFSDQVTGKVTLDTKNITWQQALEVILDSHNLKRIDLNGVWFILPSKLYFERQQQQQQIDALEHVINHSIQTIPIQYANAKQVADLLATTEASLLKQDVKISVDVRTNRLLVLSSPEDLLIIKNVVKQIDIPVKQVEIQVRMVTIRDNVDKQLGIEWGTNINQTITSNTDIAAQFDNGFNINLPIASPAGSVSLQLAKLGSSQMLDLELTALQLENQAEIIATPKILASNAVKSKIEQGTEIPYLQSAAYGATSISFKKAVLSLEVTPQINQQNEILLDLNITQDARGESIMTSTGPAVAIDTQQITTQVSAKSGETVVLGGIYQQQIIKTIKKVPYLADIPYLGSFFRSTSTYSERRELLVFVTPNLVAQAL